jgi:hypothetical protein
VSAADSVPQAWVTGDIAGLRIPVHPEALYEGGPAFLTDAFRRTGVIGRDNRVTAITRFDELAVGGTGCKVLLSVVYEQSRPDLPTELFVKFSRNFADPLRDRSRHFLEAEVRLATLSRACAFPVAVPRCLYADYETATGSGILLTERIAYGNGHIEPHWPKCSDHLLPQPLTHYRAIMRALARLAGTHRSGRLGEAAERAFPLDLDGLMRADRNPYNATRLLNRALRIRDFVARFPHLFPDHVADPSFLARFVEDAPRYLQHEDAIKQRLLDRPEYLALCHWNANIDNAWFWPGKGGELECGLIDWGGVGQMSVATTLWGCLSAADPAIWHRHLDELLALFAAEYASNGGPSIDAAELGRHLDLTVMMMGLAWLMDAPPLILAEIPDPDVLSGPHDPLLSRHETARVQLAILTNVLSHWARRDLGALLREDRLAEPAAG